MLRGYHSINYVNGNYIGPAGNNAVITGDLDIGEGKPKTVYCLSSGFGYYTRANENISLKSKTTPGASISGKFIYSAVGKLQGYWTQESSMLNSNKRIQDSYYYQEFSYDVQSKISFDKYFSILEKLYHPAGYEPFGSILSVSNIRNGGNTSVVS